MKKDCALCTYVGKTMIEPDESNEGIYLCNWTISMPYSMRHANKKRTPVKNSDAEKCSYYYVEKS